MTPNANLDKWKALYEAAIQFRDLKCWDWMLDSHVFGVQDPASGEIGYCCVMGNLGEHFALAVYQGTEGLLSYWQLAEHGEESDESRLDALMQMKCIKVSFESSGDMEAGDREVVKKLRLKFRGRNAWPIMRSFKPGYMPWYLTESEVEFLTVALQQTIEVALAFEQDPNYLERPPEGTYLVRISERDGKRIVWRDAWLAPAPPPAPVEEPFPLDEPLLQRVEKTVRPAKVEFEADIFHSPAPIAEGERPYYPLTLLVVEPNSNFIVALGLASPVTYRTEFQHQFLERLEELGVLPRAIRVKTPRSQEFFASLTPHLGIQLIVQSRLPTLEGIRRQLTEYVRR